VIPVYKSVIADFLTPVSAFLKLEKDRPYAFLLESVEGGETLARYSFLGCDPFLVAGTGEDNPLPNSCRACAPRVGVSVR
jgi:anthranilate/para-aminobenzoate synthase component I